MPFNSKTAKAAGKKGKRGGTKNKKTIVKEKLGLDNIEDLQDDVLKVWQSLIKSRNKDDKKFAAKEISKYVFAAKKESKIDLDAKGSVTINTVSPSDDGK